MAGGKPIRSVLLLLALLFLFPSGINALTGDTENQVPASLAITDSVTTDPVPASPEPADPADVLRRALYVACDFFLTQDDTWPSSENNIKAVAKALNGGSMDFIRQVEKNNTLSSADDLQQAITEAFGDADINDVSYFYISTHGVYDPAQPNLEAGLKISDGVAEETVSARMLNEMFAKIQGTKVLIFDACNSGAFIGKGLSGGATEAAFLGPDYKVLTSAGGSEESWYWSSTDNVQGASYFSSALTDGLGYHGEYGADLNRNGKITLTELYRYLMENHSASTPQSYPQEDDFVLFTYPIEAANQKATSEDSIITGITFYDTVLDANQNTVSFEFTAIRPVQMAYQLVYYLNGKWQFSSAKLKYDNQEVGGDFGDQPGAISAGRKQRTLMLSPQGDDTYGYAMIQLVTVENGRPTLHGSRVLCVLPSGGDPELSVKTDPTFDPVKHRELSILVNHKYPSLLSVSVEDENGKIIRRLASFQPTRPQQLTPAGSLFYWNGMKTDGSMAAPGEYTVRVTAYIGDEAYETVSQPFSLLDGE